MRRKWWLARGSARYLWCRRCRNRVGYLRYPWLGWPRYLHQVKVRLIAGGLPRHYHSGDNNKPEPRWRDRKSATAAALARKESHGIT